MKKKKESQSRMWCKSRLNTCFRDRNHQYQRCYDGFQISFISLYFFVIFLSSLFRALLYTFPFVQKAKKNIWGQSKFVSSPFDESVSLCVCVSYNITVWCLQLFLSRSIEFTEDRLTVHMWKEPKNEMLTTCACIFLYDLFSYDWWITKKCMRWAWPLHV